MTGTKPALRDSFLDLQRAYEPSRLFDDAASEYLAHGVVLTDAPITLAAWVYADAAVDQTIISLSDTAGTADCFLLYYKSTRKLRAFVQADGVTGCSETTANYGAENTWHHTVGVYSAHNNRTAFLDGVAATSNTTALSPANVDNARVGVLSRNHVDLVYFSGRIFLPCVWNVALSATEIAALANRQRFTPPWEVRPESIVSMPNMRTLWDPYMRARWTPTGTKPAPPPWLWRPRYVSLYVPAAPPAGNPWYAYAQQ